MQNAILQCGNSVREDIVSEDKVSVRTDGEVGVIEIDNPPVNAMGGAVRKGVWDGLHALQADDAVKAIVLACKGRTFSGGADITEFGKPPTEPALSALIDEVEASDKPVVAAVHGTAYGGGFEIALGCHYRVGPASVRLGLPEVKLGLIPGAGGTQRLPRVIGMVAALKPIVTGDPIHGGEAAEMGLIDKLIEGDLTAGAIDFARSIVGKPLVRISQDDSKLADTKADPSAFEAEATRLLSRTKRLQAPAACVEAVRNCLTMGFEEGSKAEREIFYRLREGEESKAQRHHFFAERAALKLPGVGKDVKPRPVQKIAVIGAGTMGGGITMSMATGGFDVVMIDKSPEALERGMGIIEKNYRKTQARGGFTEDEVNGALSRISTATDLSAAADVDMVIEAVYENMELKKSIFAELDKVVRPGAVLASNTSTLDVDEIAAATSRPEDVMGMHFFSPANVMKLLENIRGAKSSPDILVTANAVGKQAGKIPVTVGVCNGFAGNRMGGARARQVQRMLLEGALPQDIDAVAKAYGFAMGPLAVNDLAGLDIGYAVRKERGEKSPIADALAEMGRYGQKTGAGFYLYEGGSRTPIPDPMVEELIKRISAEHGFSPREIPEQEILDRLLFPLINEGAQILDEGIAIRSSDLDLIWVNGFGFPLAKGGPMYWADGEGVANVYERLKGYYEVSGDPNLEPKPLLRKLAEEGSSFAEWSKGRG
jgi:3-hydroxyacyl-CoA dehydrogenase